MDLVSWAFGNTSYDQNRPIFIDASNPSQYISAARARTLVRQLISGLKAAGLKRGDTVCMLALSSIYYPVFFLAVTGAGGRVAGGNPGHTVYELQHLLAKCSARFVITEPSLLEKATAASQECGIASSNIFVYEGHDEARSTRIQSWRQLLCCGESDWEILDAEQAARTTSAYYSTSGTTGAPKFAAVSHSYQITSGQYIEAETQAKPYEVSRLVSLPLMHAFAAPLVHTAALRCGTPTFIMARFSAASFLSTISQHSITEFGAVPSMLISLITSPHHSTAALGSVREVICAGAPLSSSLAESFSAALTAPSARLVQLYGATEAGWISSTPFTCQPNGSSGSGQALALSLSSSSSRHQPSTPHSAALTAPGNGATSFALQASPTPTVGVPLPGYAIRLIDSTSGDTIIGSDQPGAVQVRAPHAFLHYIGAEQATRDSFTADGWLKTGDVATRDQRGRYYIVDREKDMIKVRGWQVAPAEIESALASHPEVEDCAVLGVQDTKGASGEVPLAFVTFKKGCCIASGSGRSTGITDSLQGQGSPPPLPDEKALKSWLRERIAGYKVPEEIRIISTIPRNPAGKILRRVLREQYVSHDKSIVVAPTPSMPSLTTSPSAPSLKADILNGNALPGAALVAAAAASTTKTGTIISTPKMEKHLGELLRLSSMGEPEARLVDMSDLTRGRETSCGVVGSNGSFEVPNRNWWLLTAGNTRRRSGPILGLAATLCMLLSNRPRLIFCLPLGLGLGALVFRSALMTELRVWLMTR